MTMPNQPLKILAVCVMGFVLVGIGIYSFLYFSPKKSSERPDTLPHAARLSGTYTCLPFLNKTEPQPSECVFGLKTDDSVYYMVNFGQSEGALEQFQKGIHIVADGFSMDKESLNTDQWQKYDMKGIFTITTMIDPLPATSTPPQTPVVCSQEAKLCPDGSSVGRTGPQCEFAVCPSTTPSGGGGTGIAPFTSGIAGKILLGPTCPVMRDPPDPQCADRGYMTTVQVVRKNSTRNTPFASTESDKEGTYQIMLPPGEYSVQAVGGNPFPTCAMQDVTIEPDVLLHLDLSCDTGIR